MVWGRSTQRTMAHAKPGGKPFDGARLTRGLRPQTVIDRDGEEVRALFQCRAPARRQHEQCGRNRDRRKRREPVRELDKVSEQRFRFGG